LDSTHPGGLVKGYKKKMKPYFIKLCFVILLLSSFASTLVSSAIWQRIDPKHPKAVTSKELLAQALGRRPIKCILALERVDVSIFFSLKYRQLFRIHMYMY
jgi:hypothetical protein